LDDTTAPSTVTASGNAIGPERHAIAEGYRLVMWLGRWNCCLMTTLTLILTQTLKTLTLTLKNPYDAF